MQCYITIYMPHWEYAILGLILRDVVTAPKFATVAPTFGKVGNHASNHDDARSDRSPGAGSHATHKKSGRVVAQHDFSIEQTKQEPGIGRREERGQVRKLSSDDMPCKDIYEDISPPK